MVVIILEKVPVSLRGELTRWLLEVHPSIFVGSISAMVRELLWKLIIEKLREGGGTMIYNAANEQGYLLRMCGNTSRQVIDFDGLSLIRHPNSQK
ncbi:MAG: type I-E CRISPR-associated endoribonuclease Cas2 [Acidobacteria bacterium]|nr:type I-E CRISPR-associated endoribonuclease Cas2 [Acidobacteriota bacterium]